MCRTQSLIQSEIPHAALQCIGVAKIMSRNIVFLDKFSNIA